jgi:transcriptional regulator with XRE-family HTH domain
MFNLKNIRNKFNKKQCDLAEFLGLSQGNISDMENGRYEPDIYKIIKLAEYFGITTDELLGRGTAARPLLTEEQTQLLLDYDKLSETQRGIIKMLIDDMIKEKVKLNKR